MSKRLISIVVVFMMAASLFTGCLSSSKTPEPAKPAAQAPASSAPAPASNTAPTAKKVIKISNGVNEQHPTYLAAKKFAEIVNQKTNGKFDVQVYANAQLGDDVKATEAVKMGTLEMVIPSASPLVGIDNDLNVLDLPFLFPNEKAADAVLDGPTGTKIAKKLEDANIKLLAYYENGFRNITNSVREIKSPADLKGLKIRTMENSIHLAAFKAMGANPTPMPFSELFTAMQQKTIDGQENPVPTIFLSKFNEVQKYCTLTGHVYGPHLLLINKKLYDSLTADEKKIFDDAAAESKKFQRQTNRDMNKNYVAELRKAGMTVTELTQEQKKAFQDAVAPVYTQFEEKIGKALIDEVKAEIEKNK